VEIVVFFENTEYKFNAWLAKDRLLGWPFIVSYRGGSREHSKGESRTPRHYPLQWGFIEIKEYEKS